MPMTPDAKSALSRTIRSLRARLLEDLHSATEGAYRLSIKAEDAKLSEAARIRRARFDDWIDEQVRALPKDEQEGARERFRLEVEKDAASTLLNRIVFLRLLEASDLRAERVVTGGWESLGYKAFREFAPELIRDDESEGYQRLLQLVFDDLAIDLPGLYDNIRLTGLIPVPAATLRAVVEALDAPELESCWTDDMTLGWVYQYWNDPEREAIDAKLNDGGKVEPHEIASKTQMFTERYMVDWLLQNSLGPMWLATCKKHGWTPEVEADGTLERLEQRRVEWRAKRDAGEVELTELMPLENDAERRWAYYVPLPHDAVEQACETMRDIKILDPAVGSGHFLVVAFDLLAALYREEARHREEAGEERWSEQAIVERILEHNLHGIDLDPRAVQIAAAALWLKAQQTCAEAHPRQLNLVASNLRLSSLPADDPARSELSAEIEREVGIPAALSERLLDGLAGADHLGSLLKIDDSIDEAIQEAGGQLSAPIAVQATLEEGFPPEQQRLTMSAEEAKSALLARLEVFLSAHGHGDDLGLKLRGEQLAAGVRFMRLVKEGAYDLVVANPPYQGTSKMADATYVQAHYPLGKADLYAAFLLRGLQLVRDGGVSAMLTMRNWMFIKQYAELRQYLLEQFDLRALGDLSSGAFQEISAAQVVVSVSMTILSRCPARRAQAVALKPFDDSTLTQVGETERKRAATVCHVGRHDFDPTALKVVPAWPLVYWWDAATLSDFQHFPALEHRFECLAGLKTGSDVRFIRSAWEVMPIQANRLDALSFLPTRPQPARDAEEHGAWCYYIMGAAGEVWFEPPRRVLRCQDTLLELQVFGMCVAPGTVRLRDLGAYFVGGVAFSMIGNTFLARAHRFGSVFGSKGSSIIGPTPAALTCVLNRSASRSVIQDLNPSISFTLADVAKLPYRPESEATQIWTEVEAAFAVHEGHREASVEFRCPGPSAWRIAQDWAQAAVDRPLGARLPAYEPEYDAEPPTDLASFALGVALGRFDVDGGGVIDPTEGTLPTALPDGVCFLDGTLDRSVTGDSLGHPAAQILQAKWAEHGAAIAPGSDLRTWLRLKFFSDVHKGMYENRPIYSPLSSAKKTFVAYVSIHRWNADTLRALLAEHLQPALKRLEGEIADLRESRQSADKKVALGAERRYDQVTKWKLELDDFIAKVEQCAEKGPPPIDPTKPEREVDARYDPGLDDGVMINSAALWPLLEPQWKDPKKWWKELATSKGKKDYDWSHLAARYFPARVDEKCQADPSLGVAHGCFWKYHAETAYKWELRLQDEIAPDFAIDEEGSDEARAAFEREHPEKVVELKEAEEKRRERKAKKKAKEAGSPGPLFDAPADASEGAEG